MHDPRFAGPFRGRRWVGFLFFVVAGTGLLTLAFMVLWNHLMPGLFGLHPLCFWQALGLLVLVKLLVGHPFRALGHRFHNRHHHLRVIERWESMTPEERERFREGLRGRCRWGRHAEPPRDGGEA
jgi:Ca2+/H+ antiporter, TMEM165/GDT1 family